MSIKITTCQRIQALQIATQLLPLIESLNSLQMRLLFEQIMAVNPNACDFFLLDGFFDHV